MKVEVLNLETNVIKAKDLKIGELAICTDDDRPDVKGHVMLKTYDGLISINDPHKTWHSQTSLLVVKLPVGTQIILTQ